MSNNNSDEELAKLLGELANLDPLTTTLFKKEEEEMVTIPKRPKSQKIKRKKKEEEVVLAETTSLANDQKLPEIFNEQFQKVASQYGAVFEEIIDNYKKDREQAQEVIDRFMDVIVSGGKVPRVYLEKISDVVRAKNEIAQTAIRALDSLPKLISSTKGNNMFNSQVNMSFDASHLRDILEISDEDN